MGAKLEESGCDKPSAPALEGATTPFSSNCCFSVKFCNWLERAGTTVSNWSGEAAKDAVVTLLGLSLLGALQNLSIGEVLRRIES